MMLLGYHVEKRYVIGAGVVLLGVALTTYFTSCEAQVKKMANEVFTPKVPQRGIKGYVYFEGEPLPQGTICFAPLDFGKEPDTLPITDGFYSGNISEGEKYVTVFYRRPSPTKTGPFGEAVYETLIPPYHPLGPSVVTIHSGENEFDFDMIKQAFSPFEEENDPAIYQRLLERNREHRRKLAAQRDAQ